MEVLKMILLQIIPKHDNNKTLKMALNEKERELRNKGRFIRVETGKWRHKTYNGWINWESSFYNIIVATIKCKNPKTEWQITQAFMGFLGRYFSNMIENISISYR
jgi:hypothetical protein